MPFTAYPQLTFADVFSQPSETTFGRRLVVTFDSTNIHQTNDGYFSLNDNTTLHPVVVRIFGNTIETNPSGYEDYSFSMPGQSVTGILHFTTFTNAQVVDGYKISFSAAYGAVEVREALPINYLDDGYNADPYVEFTSYGNGIFLFDTTLKDSYGNNVDPGYGQYEFTYAAPFQIPLKTAPDTLIIGNSIDLTNPANAVLDEVKITTAAATKTRTRTLAGSYDISVEATSPISSEPDAKTLVLLHLDNNAQFIIDSLRGPLDSANLPDSVLTTIVSLRNDRIAFLNYVHSLHISGTIVDGSIDTRPFEEQLYDLVSVLNNVANSAQYYKLSGNFAPSELIVNDNFKYAAVFAEGTYFIEKTNLINNNEGSIELWIAPLANLLGDFKRRIYLDSINHAILGSDGNFSSITTTLIKLPDNIVAQHINFIRLANTKETDNYNFADNAFLTTDGTTIILQDPLPQDNTPIIIDYIPLSSNNDRITLYKDDDDTLIFAVSANGILYHLTHDIRAWLKNEWHRVMITWKTNDKNSLDHIAMYVDGTDSQVIKFGQGYKFNTFKFKQEQTINVSTKIIPQNIQFVGMLDRLYIGSDFTGTEHGFCRMANLRVSNIERKPGIDARGNLIDLSFDGGSKSATPEIFDGFTTYLEDFDPKAGFVTNFAALQDPVSGIHDLHIIVRDNFNLVRGVENGQVEHLLRTLLKIIVPAEARTIIDITTNN